MLIMVICIFIPVVKMCLIFNLSADKLAENWFEFKSKNPKVGTNPTDGHLDIFEKNYLTKEYIRENEIGKIKDDADDMDLDRHLSADEKEASEATVTEKGDDEEMEETVLDANGNEDLSVDERNTLFRKAVVASYGTESLEESDFHSAGEVSLIIKPIDESKHVKQEGYHFCGFNLYEMSCCFEDQLKQAAEFYTRRMGIPFVTDLSEDLIDDSCYLCFVRKQPHKVKLNTESLLVEGTGDTYDNETILKHMPVDLSRLPSYSFFPGQMIAFRGTRVKNTMRITHIIDPPSHTPAETMLQPLSQPLQILVVSGPFSAADKVESLVKYVGDAKPNLMILIGPFVDIRDFDACVNRDDDETFVKTFVSRLCKAGAEKVIVVSSMHDLNAVNVVPTPALPLDHPKAISFPNPCFFEVNGIRFAVTSVDILKHMMKQEFSTGLSDRMKRIASHLLSQRRLYPLFPVDREANVDYRSYEFLQFPCRPDFLILPSDLKSFVLDVDGCVCLNPERITKGFLSRIRVTQDEHRINPDVQVFRL